MSDLDKEITQETANYSTASVQNSDVHSQSSQPNGEQPHCGTPQQPQFAAQTPYGAPAPPPYGVPYPQPRRSNGVGTAGFVITLVNMFLGFIPVVNFLCFILWPLGLILSIIGMLKSPRGLGSLIPSSRIIFSYMLVFHRYCSLRNEHCCAKL